jgi:predicted SAM-dependent methyltransferase
MIKKMQYSINKLGRRKKCIICSQTFSNFLPYEGNERKSGFISDLEIIGSDTKNFSCPYCFSHDRERHLFMYFDKLSLWKDLQGTTLHFAPEKHLSRKISNLNPKSYIKADLYSTDDSVEKIDITKIPYPDNSFDFLICNHVLEHITDIQVAINEIYRVLKSGGQAVLQTPYSSILAQSFQDENIDTDALREKFYGQKDHVRVFGKDFFTLLEEKGFKLKLKNHLETLSEFDTYVFGVNSKEDLILVEK